MDHRVIVSAVIEKEGKILFGRKAPGVGPYPDTWHLPGGGVNLGEETLIDAVRREVREETGIEIDHIEPLAFDEDNEPDKHGMMMHYVFLVFRVRYAAGALRAADDIVELCWFAREELDCLLLTRPSEKLLQ